jgi:pectinesterase
MKSRLSAFAGLLPLFFTAALGASPAREAAANAIVDASGHGQFKTVQEAINAAPQLSAVGSRWVIYVRAGTYRELVYVQREKRFITLVGENPATTTITFDLHANLPGSDGKPIGTFRTPTTFIDADDFSAEDITFENSAGAVGQALAVRVDGDRVAFRRCRFLGFQDTILLNRGRQYFADCEIAGAVDFIFGGATAWFERCEIRCVRDGYITAASTPDFQAHGFVFNRCKISATAPEVHTYLGRPWRDYASVVWLNTEMSDAVRPVGWHNWSKPEREKTARYAEFNSAGAKLAERAAWAKRLTEAEAKKITVAEVLGGADRWDPTPLK